MNLRMPSSAAARGWFQPRNSKPTSAATSGGPPAANIASRSGFASWAMSRYLADTAVMVWPAFLPEVAGSYSVIVPVFDEVLRVPCGQREDRFHRVDPDWPWKEAGVGHEQAGHAVEGAEAVGDSAPGVLAHPRRAHQVDSEQLKRSGVYRTGQQLAKLGGIPYLRRAAQGQQDSPGASCEHHLGCELNPAQYPRHVTVADLIGHLRADAGHVPHPPRAGVLDQAAGRHHVVVAGHQLAELTAVPWQGHRDERGCQVDRGQQDAIGGELAYLVRLVHALPAEYRLVEERDHLGVRMQRQVPAELPRR